jgi:hypothetical protein
MENSNAADYFRNMIRRPPNISSSSGAAFSYAVSVMVRQVRSFSWMSFLPFSERSELDFEML